ncbi:Rpn family recombination-promoting nuclease/putative transposase [Dorea sp. Marseille-P4042]|uniref:Rpn family recombination-promoting nuclease/putative transposase n=1 Tax=Dorea sp. Marseille-P4042 TaxID=2080749 RepID=UPI000CF8E778|nr:Rpn family recombination-promoting nuclease/putative transposase [Dorea sp. Marseille-P4042]
METNNTTTSNGVHNTHTKDNSAKIVFGDPVLCAQFLKGYTDIPLFKEIKPEDIENVSSHFLPLFQESRDSDTVNKIRIGDSEIYLIALIEHQSENDFDMSFRILRYIVFIWTDYAAQQEKLHKGITKSKAFLYPPILPIVYYEGSSTWSAPLNFKNRVFLSDVFGDYIPSFNYLVVPLNKYSKQDLIEKNDELSLIFLINQLQSSSEFHALKDIPKKYTEHLTENTPDYLLKIIGKVIAVLLHKLNVPDEEVYEVTDQITRRKFSMMFDNFQAYDVQETRRVSREEGRLEGRIEGERAGRIEGERAGRIEGERAGRIEGERLHLIKQVIKRIELQYSVNQIAESLLEPLDIIQPIYDIALQQLPDYNAEKILEQLNS